MLQETFLVGAMFVRGSLPVLREGRLIRVDILPSQSWKYWESSLNGSRRLRTKGRFVCAETDR